MRLAAHRLASAELDHLASGCGDLNGGLLAGQVSKRMLQILAVLGELPARCPDSPALGSFTRSYGFLAALRQRAPAAVDTVLRYPQVGAWAAHVLRRLVSARDGRSLDDDLGHFGAVAAAAALAAGEGFELTLRVRADRSLMIPTFGLARLDAGPAWCTAWAGPAATSIRLDLAGQLVEVPVRSAASEPGWWPLRRLGSTVDGCRVEVLLDDLDPYRDCHRVGAAARIPAADVPSWQASLDEAWESLVRRHRPRARSLSTGLAALVPLQPTAWKGESSASFSEACGSVALTPPADGRALAVALVHEFQHSKLSALLDLVPLHQAGTAAAHYAPWRPDPRPLGGLFQGAYAYLGLVDLWGVQRLREPEAPARLAHFEFARWLPAVRRVLLTLSRSGRLTAAGERFVAGMRHRLAELPGAPVPRELELLALDARLDHRTSWRLHNLRPDEDQVTGWAEAWLAGLSRPPGAPRPAAVVAGRRWSGTTDRLELAYRRVRDPGRLAALCTDPARLAAELPTAGPADVAYARSDYQAAARLYHAVLAETPGSVDAWAGLVLACRRLRTPGRRVLVCHPERVRALYQRVTAVCGVPPSAHALAGWLDSG
jgi:HEXXH motif-containing protein